MFHYHTTARNRLSGYLKGLAVQPHRTYRFSADVLGGAVDVYLSARGIVDGNRSHFTEPCDTWQRVTFEFTTNDTPSLAEFSSWGIAFLKNDYNTVNTYVTDTYVDNVTLIDVDAPSVNLIEGGDFERTRRSEVYNRNWNGEILGSTGAACGIRLTADPLDPTNRCLLLPCTTVGGLNHRSPLSVNQLSWFADNDTDIACVAPGDASALFLMVKHGRITLRQAEQVVTAQDGELLFCPSHTTCEYTLHGGSDTAYYRLAVEGDMLPDICAALKLTTLCVIPMTNISSLTNSVVAMSRISPTLRTKALAIDGLLMQWFAELETQLFSKDVGTKYGEALEAITERLRTQPELPITVDELAAECRLSKTHFINSFKAYTGETPNRYRLQHLVGKACSLLTETEMTVQEIAYSLGADDPQYFSRLFRSIRGITPREYRNRHRA